MGQSVAPSFEPVRGHRGRPGPVRLPSGGRTGRAPRWPLATPPNPAERRVWRDLWRLPQAVVWERQGCARVLARFARVVVEAEEPNASGRARAEASHLEDHLGLTPVALRKLLWVVADAEVVALPPLASSACQRIRPVS